MTIYCERPAQVRPRMVFTREADAQALRRIEYIHPQSATSVSNVAREYHSRGGAGVGDGGMDE